MSAVHDDPWPARARSNASMTSWRRSAWIPSSVGNAPFEPRRSPLALVEEAFHAVTHIHGGVLGIPLHLTAEVRQSPTCFVGCIVQYQRLRLDFLLDFIRFLLKFLWAGS